MALNRGPLELKEQSTPTLSAEEQEALNMSLVSAAVLNQVTDIAAIETLIKDGAAVYLPVISSVLEKKNAALIKLLMRHQHDPAEIDKKGKTALELVLDSELKEIIKKEIVDLYLTTENLFARIPDVVLGKYCVQMLRLLKLETDEDKRVAFIAKLKERNVDPNVKYVKQHMVGYKTEYTLLLSVMEFKNSASSIRALLELGADPGPAIEHAAGEEGGDHVWENILTILDAAKQPIDIALLSRALFWVGNIKVEALRNRTIERFFADGVDLALTLKEDKFSPKVDSVEERINLYATFYVSNLADKGYWSSIAYFLPYLNSLFADKAVRRSGSDTVKTQWGKALVRALHANTTGSLEVADQLFNLGADVNQALDVLSVNAKQYNSEKKFTFPLIIAARKNDREPIKRLLAAGGDPNCYEYSLSDRSRYPTDGVSFFEILIAQNAWGFIAEIIPLAKIAFTPKTRNTIAFAALSSNQAIATALVEPMLKLGAFVNYSAQHSNQRMLDVAVENKDKASVALLLAGGATPYFDTTQSPEELRELGGDALVGVFDVLRKEKIAAERKRAVAARGDFGEQKPASKEVSKAAEKPAPKISQTGIEKTQQADAALKPTSFFKPLVKQATQAESNFIADFRKINEGYLQDNFLVNKKGSEVDLLAAISTEVKAHPNGFVAIASALAKKYPGSCDDNNNDFLVELRVEKFKHEKLWSAIKFWKWLSHTTVHKGGDNQLRFYSSVSFAKHMAESSKVEKDGIAREMRDASLDAKNDSRSATLVRRK
jgi:hypothetical protein